MVTHIGNNRESRSKNNDGEPLRTLNLLNHDYITR